MVVRVIAPTGRDAELIREVLEQNGIPAELSSFAHLPLADADDDSLGPLLIAEEALQPASIRQLSTFLQAQPSWSDLPILILTGSGRETLRSSRARDERLPLGSPVLLERPIRTATLVSSVQAALRARTRQYEIRNVVAELKHEREILEAMLDNLPVGVVLSKENGQIVRGNRRLEEILRHPLIPSPDTEKHEEWIAFHPDGRRVKGPEFPLPRAIKAGHALPSEDYLYQRGDGTQAWISLAAAPIINDLGVVTGGVVAISDIDQQKRSESALIQNEKLAAVGRLAASISHEINNPLESVTNLIYLARHSAGLTAEASSLLDTADRELSRVSQVVSHTLRFHRQATRPTAVTGQELLEPVLGLYAGRLLNLNIHLDVRHRSQKPVTCLEGEVRQVLNNLVGNAIDSMKNGGILSVRTRDARSWKSGLPGIRILIGDTGHGMPRAVVEQIFDAFYTTKGINGTGLGLWISQGIVAKHNGALRVRSSTQPGRSGTVFTLFLPSDRADPPAA